jgi:iron(III) transport system permease protein
LKSIIEKTLEKLPILLFTFISLIFLTPIILILTSLFQGYSDSWQHLFQTVLAEYLTNTTILVAGVSIGVFVLGVSSAWIVTTSDFKGKKIFKWALLLPLAIPPYIMAYAFTGLFDSGGTMNNVVNSIFNIDENYNFFPSVRNLGGAITIFSFTLYPYVYLIAQTAFTNQSRDVFDIARTLGLSKKSTFYKLALPLARPSIIAGLMIVAMETISDFGAVEHFAIPTFTSGIFRTWFGMNDIVTAKQLAAVLFIFFLSFLLIEKYSRKKIQFNLSLTTNRELVPIKLYGLKSLLATIFCSIPILIGFLIPITQLLYWTISFNLEYFDLNFVYSAINTISLALISGIFCVSVSIIVNYLLRMKENRPLSLINKAISSGYGIPGVVLALGVLDLFSLINIFTDTMLIGSVFGLILIYSIKFYALPNSSIESGFRKINKSVDDAALSLGSTKLNLLKRIHLPMLKNSSLIALLLISIEVIKELPATLILRPFNFDTLSVSAYMFASDERMVEAAAPSIAIVIVSLIPILLLINILDRNKNE